MLTVEIRVNGSIISALSVINKRYTDGGYEYEYQGVSFPASATGEVKTWHGSLTHYREQGAEVLVRKLFEAMTKESPPYHKDPTGKTREPPHCPTCDCEVP